MRAKDCSKMVFFMTHAVLHVSFFLWLVSPTISDECYTRYSGVPGIPGHHGANGKDGLKGEKGDPGESTQPVKGQKGDRGMPGPPGRPGLRGQEGMPGPAGLKGLKGQKRLVAVTSSDDQSFFSYKKTGSKLSFPADQVIEFDGSLSRKRDGRALSGGTFTADPAGVYYIVYHVSVAQTACLAIKKRDTTLVQFCDRSQGVLVTSGSVVVQLQKGDTVSLHTTKMSQIIGKDADSTFTGFLLFPM